MSWWMVKAAVIQKKDELIVTRVERAATRILAWRTGSVMVPPTAIDRDRSYQKPVWIGIADILH